VTDDDVGVDEGRRDWAPFDPGPAAPLAELALTPTAMNYARNEQKRALHDNVGGRLRPRRAENPEARPR
jgi:hypothetical protein